MKHLIKVINGVVVSRVDSYESGPVATSPPAALTEPTAAELAVNFASAMARWIEAGVPVVSQAIYDARAAACGSCELWDGAARFGLGKCQAPGCGCTKFKRWLATERCKHPQGSRWSALEPVKRGVQGQIPGGQQATTAPA